MKTQYDCSIGLIAYWIGSGLIYAALRFYRKIKQAKAITVGDVVCWLMGGFALLPIQLFFILTIDLWSWLDSIVIIRRPSDNGSRD